MVELKKNSHTPYSKMTKKEWLAHGQEKGYDKLSNRAQLRKKCPRFYGRGMKKDYMKHLIPISKKDKSRDWEPMSVEKILNYGIKKNYHKLARTELAHKDRDYYNALRAKRLIGRLILTKKPIWKYSGRSSLEKSLEPLEIELLEGNFK